MKVTFLFVLFSFLYTRVYSQANRIAYYRKDIGMYFHLDSKIKRQRISYMEDWYFYVSLKNDSVMTVQDFKKNISQPKMEFKISVKVDTVYVKRISDGKKYKVSKELYRSLD